MNNLNMKKDIVVGLGEILWDVFPGRKVLGGAPANFAYHISQLGYNGFVVSAVGKDSLGEEIYSALEQKKLNYLIEETDYPTGTVQVTLDSGGMPRYEISENVAWDNIPFTTEILNLAKMTRVVSFGTLAQRSKKSGGTVKKFLASMPQDSFRIFDINLRQHFYNKDIIHDSLMISNILKINDEEIAAVADLYEWEGDERQICEKLFAGYELEIIILTKGTNGSFIFTPDQVIFSPTPEVRVVDTVGAGDAFTAAFMAAYLQGAGVGGAHRLAVEVSAYVCQHQGAMPELAKQYRNMFG